jgi:hypothetical protein
MRLLSIYEVFLVSEVGLFGFLFGFIRVSAPVNGLRTCLVLPYTFITQTLIIRLATYLSTSLHYDPT